MKKRYKKTMFLAKVIRVKYTGWRVDLYRGSRQYDLITYGGGFRRKDAEALAKLLNDNWHKIIGKRG